MTECVYLHNIQYISPNNDSTNNADKLSRINLYAWTCLQGTLFHNDLPHMFQNLQNRINSNNSNNSKTNEVQWHNTPAEVTNTPHTTPPLRLHTHCPPLQSRLLHTRNLIGAAHGQSPLCLLNLIDKVMWNWRIGGLLIPSCTSNKTRERYKHMWCIYCTCNRPKEKSYFRLSLSLTNMIKHFASAEA